GKEVITIIVEEGRRTCPWRRLCETQCLVILVIHFTFCVSHPPSYSCRYANTAPFPTASPVAHGSRAQQCGAVRPQSHVRAAGRPSRPSVRQNDGGDQGDAPAGLSHAER